MDELTKKRAKIRWQCRRGMLELDLLFEKFNHDELEKLNLQEIAIYSALLENYDQLLYEWLMARATPDTQELQEFVKRIALHNQTK